MKKVFAQIKPAVAASLTAILALTTAPDQQPLSASAQQLVERKQKGSGFPGFGFMVSPAEYAAKYSYQPVFKLKTDFPAVQPSHLPEFMEKIDFRTQQLGYLEAVRDCDFQGNLPDWDPFKNHVRNWYHIPWPHPTTTGPNAYPPNGDTKGFHGLIKEAPLSPRQLGPGQKGADYSVDAITLLNEFAGYTMGRMRRDP